VDDTSVLLLGGSENAVIVALDPTGKKLWEQQLKGPLSGGYIDNLQTEANGAMLSIYYIGEEIGEYMVVDPRGAIVFREIIHGDRELSLSPGGKYYYRTRQSSRELEVTRVGGSVRKLVLPGLPEEPAKEGISSSVGFVSADELIAVTFVPGKPPQKLLFDLREEPARGVALAPEAKVLPLVAYANEAAKAFNGEIIHVDDFEFMGPEKGAACFSPEGKLLWRTKTMARWVIAADDRPMAALIKSGEISIVNVASGSVLSSTPLNEELIWIYEGSLHGNRLVLAGEGGPTSTDQILVTADVDAGGNITNAHATKAHAWGIGASRGAGGIASRGEGETWTVVGFHK
jgi:hypothetical protein